MQNLLINLHLDSMMRSKSFLTFIAAFIAVLTGSLSLAYAGVDHIEPWKMGFQSPVSPLKEQIEHFHNFLLIIMTAVTVFVLLLLAYIVFRFRASKNPVPSKTTHNTLLEIIWTTIPVIILLVIAIPSFRILFYAERVENADMTLKIVGHQWYWEYEYPDSDNLTFESYMIKDADLKPDQPRLVSVDNVLVLPVDKTIRLQVTAADVIHDWAMPSMGIKMDAVPGRLNETWVRIDKPGTYYGQCSELCGVLHGFMPIQIKAVSQEEFDAWVKEAKEKFAHNGKFNTYAAAE